MNRIYLDSHATTPVDPRVLDAMLPFFTEHFGNASSRNHPFGWKAGKAVEQAREQVGSLIGARSATSCSRAARPIEQPRLKGAARRAPLTRRHIVTVCTEARAVWIQAERSSAKDFASPILEVDREGRIDLDRLREAVGSETLSSA